MRRKSDLGQNAMLMEIASSDMKLRETNLEQSREDHGGRIAAHLAMLLVPLVLLLLLVGRTLWAKPVTEQEKKDWFYQYTTEKMTQFKPLYYLYEELSDPAALLKQAGWELRTSEAENQQDAANKLLARGHGLHLSHQAWHSLKTETL